MKRILSIILMILFAWGSVAPSAMASVCVSDEGQGSSMCAMVDGECHNGQSDDQGDDLVGCQGACLCMHVSTNSIFSLKSNGEYDISFAKGQRLAFHDELLTSITESPLQHPPKDLL